MPFVFECPHCHCKSEVDDSLAGQKGPCFSCGREIHLPTVSTYSAASALLRSKRRMRLSPRFLVTFLAASVLLVLVVAAWYIVSRAVVNRFGTNSPSAQLATSRNHLELIAKAMRSYEADYGSLPPAYVTNQKGQPVHSWRILLLPYLGHEALYNEYQFDEPWDGPNNSALAGRMPSVFASPADPTASGFSDTSYMVIVGPSTAFPGDTGLSSSQIQDGTSVTILVTEVFQSSTNWMKPADLDFSQIQSSVNGASGIGISSGHAGGALIVTADGKTHWLRDENSPEVIAALMTANGRESLVWSDVLTNDP